MPPFELDRRPAPPRGVDAVTLLGGEHRVLEHLFGEYEMSFTSGARKALIARICDKLNMQLRIEEEIFYPALRAAWKDILLMPERIPTHAGLKTSIEQLQHLATRPELPLAAVGNLAESVRLHIRESRLQLFPQARSAALDLGALGARMACRRDELLAGGPV